MQEAGFRHTFSVVWTVLRVRSSQGDGDMLRRSIKICATDLELVGAERLDRKRMDVRFHQLSHGVEHKAVPVDP